MYQVDIAEAARANDAFRRVLHTTEHVQLVVMTLQPGEDIGAEVHVHNDQVLSFIDGAVRAEVAGDVERGRSGRRRRGSGRHGTQLHQHRYRPGPALHPVRAA